MRFDWRVMNEFRRDNAAVTCSLSRSQRCELLLGLLFELNNETQRRNNSDEQKSDDTNEMTSWSMNCWPLEQSVWNFGIIQMSPIRRRFLPSPKNSGLILTQFSFWFLGVYMEWIAWTFSQRIKNVRELFMIWFHFYITLKLSRGQAEEERSCEMRPCRHLPSHHMNIIFFMTTTSNVSSSTGAVTAGIYDYSYGICLR